MSSSISDEAVSAYQDAWLAAVTDPQWAAIEEGPVRAGLAAVAPLLVSAEAERLRAELNEALGMGHERWPELLARASYLGSSDEAWDAAEIVAAASASGEQAQ